MKVEILGERASPRDNTGAAMIEVIVSLGLVALVLTSLYAGVTMSFFTIDASRQDLRATQILLERMEGIRLFNWNQLVYSNMIPATFTNYYYPLASGNESKGITYVGNMTITNATLNPSATYQTNMQAIIVDVFWTNYHGYGLTKKIVSHRSMTTYSTDTGMQNYVFAN